MPPPRIKSQVLLCVITLVKVPAPGVLLQSVVLRFYFAEEHFKPLDLERFEITIAAQLSVLDTEG